MILSITIKLITPTCNGSSNNWNVWWIWEETNLKNGRTIKKLKWDEVETKGVNKNKER